MQARTHKLADVASVFNGKTPSRKEQRTKGFPVLKIKDVNEDGQFVGGFDSFVDEEFAKQFSDKFVRVGDTLVLNAAHSASYVGSKVYFAEPAVVGSLPTGEWLLIRPDAHKAVPEYVHYWVQSEPTGRRITDLVKGIHLYPKDVARLRISLPPLPEQKRIAAILAKADRLRRLRRTARDISDTYLQSVFLEMFGDPVSNPMGWEVVRLSEQIKLIGGYAFKSGDFVENGIPLIRIGTVNTGLFDDSNLAYLPHPFVEEYEKFLLYPGDLVITLTGTVGKDDYGNVCVLGNDFPKYFLNQRVAKITIKSGALTAGYVLHAFKHPKIKQHLTRPSRGIRQANISNEDILGLHLPLPPLPLQQKFAHIVHQFERVRAQQREAQRQAEYLFQTLLHRAFRGELEDPKGLGDP